MRDNRTNERTTNIEDRATQPMEAGGSVSQLSNHYGDNENNKDNNEIT